MKKNPIESKLYKNKYEKYKYKYNKIKNDVRRSCSRTNLGDKTDPLTALLNFLKKWDNDNYDGMVNVVSKLRSTYENIIEYKTNIDKTQCPTITNIKDLKLNSYEPNVSGITSFLKDFNFIESKKFSFTHPTFYRIEGSSSEHLETHNKILKDFEKEPKYIMEIGFNSGVSAINFLENTENTIVVSFDIMLHDYCWYSKMFIDDKYPNRHILIAGDSAIQVKTMAPLLGFKFDLIFIDGDHSYLSAYIDILNCEKVSHKDTVVILDNVSPHAGCGIGPYLAMNQAIKDQLVVFKKHYEIKNYREGFAVLQYKYDVNKSNSIDYKKIERLIPTYNLTNILNSIKIPTDNDKKKVAEILSYFKKYNLVIDGELQDKLKIYQ